MKVGRMNLIAEGLPSMQFVGGNVRVDIGGEEFELPRQKKAAEASIRKLLEDDRRRKGACARCGANMLRADYRAVTVLKCPLGHTQRYIPRSDLA